MDGWCIVCICCSWSRGGCVCFSSLDFLGSPRGSYLLPSPAYMFWYPFQYQPFVSGCRFSFGFVFRIHLRGRLQRGFLYAFCTYWVYSGVVIMLFPSVRAELVWSYWQCSWIVSPQQWFPVPSNTPPSSDPQWSAFSRSDSVYRPSGRIAQVRECGEFPGPGSGVLCPLVTTRPRTRRG